MNKNRIAQYCCAALVAVGIGLNIQNAIADYGIGEKSLSLVADPGSNSGSNSNSNGGGSQTISGFSKYSETQPHWWNSRDHFGYCPTHRDVVGYCPEIPCIDVV